MIVSPFSVALSIFERVLILVGIGFTPTIVTYSIPLFMYIYMHIKNRVKRLNGFVNQRKFTKQKIKSLTQGNSKVILEDIAKIANDNSIENTDDKEHDSLRITKMILKEFDSIVKKIKDIKTDFDYITCGRLNAAGLVCPVSHGMSFGALLSHNYLITDLGKYFGKMILDLNITL